MQDDELEVIANAPTLLVQQCLTDIDCLGLHEQLLSKQTWG